MNAPTDRLFNPSGTLRSTLAMEAFMAQVRELAEDDQPPAADPVPEVVETRPAATAAG
jgi:hypothetical protein